MLTKRLILNTEIKNQIVVSEDLSDGSCGLELHIGQEKSIWIRLSVDELAEIGREIVAFTDTYKPKISKIETKRC